MNIMRSELYGELEGGQGCFIRTGGRADGVSEHSFASVIRARWAMGALAEVSLHLGQSCRSLGKRGCSAQREQPVPRP